MNKFYKCIWNHRVGTFFAVSELAKCGGRKVGGGTNSTVPSGVWFTLRPLVASMVLAASGNAWALPVGGEVSAGSASIGGGATEMKITQSSQNAAINWQAFDIASGETVNFRQPDSSSITLNRVLGSDPSAIMGTLSANGQVFLVNPSGVLVGADASVNVGGMVASTMNLSDSDFMAGRYTFAGSGDGSIVNQGTINADGGYVALLGAHVSNQGTIQANLGTVALASGDAVTLDVAGDSLLNVAVDPGALDALVQNGGMIQADGGTVLMNAQSAGDLFQSAVNNTGVIRAQSIENRNGNIMLTGDMDNSTVSIGGTLDVSGKGGGQTGGNLTATGRHVGLYDVVIDASGDAGGGTVLIGGGYQGNDPTVQNADATYMSADSAINANADVSGDGGTVVLWADNSTRAYGSISARGGEQFGNGGLIETSGGWLDVAGIRIDTRATNGDLGMWLLDPADITISNAATSDATRNGNVFEPNSGVNTANINVADLVTGLGSSNITVTTENSGASGTGNGDITVRDAIVWEDPTTLTLNADRDINIDAAITATLGSLVANAERDVNVNADVTTTTGDLTFNAQDNVTLAAATTITTGNLTALAGQDVNVGANVTVTTGDVILIADNDGTGPGAILGGTALITCGSNCITIGTGDLMIRFNPESYATTDSEILAYGLNLTGGGELDAKAWVFGDGQNKVYDGTRDAIVSGLEPDITSMQPPVNLGTVSNALFDSKDVGTEKPISFETTFDAAAYDLFAPFGTTVGTYFTRADITPAPLTITANDGSKVFGETFPLSPQAFTSEGLVNSETVESVSLTSPGAVATASVDGSPYPITPADATGGTFSASNYTINYVDGALLVNNTAVNPSDPTPTDPSTSDPTPTDPSTTDPSTADPGTTDPTPTDPSTSDPSTADPGTTDPSTTDPTPTDPADLLEPELAALPPGSVFRLATELAGEAITPDTSSPDDDGRMFVDTPVDNSEGLELTFATAAINMPTVQLDRVVPLSENDFGKLPSDSYVAPVYPPKQDRF